MERHGDDEDGLMLQSDSYRVYLAPAEYIDSDHPLVRRTAEDLALGAADSAEVIRRLFRKVRDIRYGAPDFDRLDSFKASTLLREGGGYCVPKAAAFTALARAVGFPARIAFADVTNHLATPATLELMGGNVFAWHGYAEVWLNGRWIKLSPTFDTAMCKAMNVPVLEFDGASDAHLQTFDAERRLFMSFDHVHGSFHDVPARFLVGEMVRLYPKTCAIIRDRQTR
jgi:transglutaminase-like putative cysteine protease